MHMMYMAMTRIAWMETGELRMSEIFWIEEPLKPTHILKLRIFSANLKDPTNLFLIFFEKVRIWCILKHIALAISLIFFVNRIGLEVVHLSNFTMIRESKNEYLFQSFWWISESEIFTHLHLSPLGMCGTNFFWSQSRFWFRSGEKCSKSRISMNLVNKLCDL
jgi:hypothetical protein